MAIDDPISAPENPWDLIPLDEQFDNHDEYRPELIDALDGRVLELHPAAGGAAIRVAFEPGAMAWSGGEPAPGWGETGTLGSEPFSIRDLDIVGVVAGDLRERRSILWILDLAAGRALANASRLVGDGPVEETVYLQFGIDGPLKTPFERTTELVGHRIHQRYSTTHAFEHIHLNPSLYSFHCLEGPEAGIGDTDKADYFKIADRLYLFSWHERQQPFNGAVLTDLDRMRSLGRLFGWNEVGGQALQIRTGSISTVLNVTRYDGC